MKRISIIAFLITAAALLPVAASAFVPLLSYQGVLTDAGGVVVGDGTYDVTFKIYNQQSGGTELWSESRTVQVTKGIFSVILGETVWLNLPFDDLYWLGISVEGETELTPRIMLTSAPYSMSSGGVYGNNVFPGNGYVGVHTDSPDYPLEVWGADNQVAICAHSADPDWASIYVQADNPSASPGYGYMRSVMRAHHYVDNTDAWRLHVGSGLDLSVLENGNTGLGIVTPYEKLEVAGAIRLGAAGGSFPGTIQWTGTDFEGYDGSSWLSLTGAGSGGLPAGTSGQTLRHNGSDWVVASNLYNGGSFIGIGTTSPETNLHILSSNPGLNVEASSSSDAAEFMAMTTGGNADYVMLMKMGPDLSGSKAGIPFANLSMLQVGGQAGPLMIDVIPSQPIHFVIGNNEWMRLTADGELQLRENEIAKLSAWADADGGYLHLNDGAGAYHTRLQPGAGGVGGYLSLMRSQAEEGFRLEGNHGGTNEPYMAIMGSTQDLQVDFASAGDLSVQLPVDAVGDAEIVDEPGVASATYSEATGLGLGAGVYSILASRSITVPDAGYVLVMATSSIKLDHMSGTQTMGIFGVSHLATTLMGNQSANLVEPASAPSGSYERIVTCHGLYEAIGEGTTTFHFLGFNAGGTLTAYDVQLTIVYLPTAYGTVEPTATVDPLMASAPDAEEREESIAVNEARVERELAAMRDRIADLERRLETENR